MPDAACTCGHPLSDHQTPGAECVHSALDCGCVTFRKGSAASVDRTVHAETNRFEIVRYERAGKWFVEYKIGLIPCEHIGVNEAARRAVDAETVLEGVIYTGRPGGSVFDRKVASLRAS